MMPIHHHRRVLRAVLASSLAIPVLVAGCGSGDAEARPAGAQSEFVGTVVYQLGQAGGGDSLALEAFRSSGPYLEEIAWGSRGRVRLVSSDPISARIVVGSQADSVFFSLNQEERIAKPAKIVSQNPEDLEGLEPEIRALIGRKLAAAQVERGEEERTYAGRRCRLYTVVQSPVMMRGSRVVACLAEDLRPRPSRISFDWDNSGQPAPVPLLFGIREGLPLWMEITSQEAIVTTYTAVTLNVGEPADSLFTVPPGYTLVSPAAEG